jgi:competence protein ComEC
METANASASGAVVSAATVASRAPVFSIAPLAPVLAALAAGIIMDRSFDPFHTKNWLMLALVAFTTALMLLRRGLLSSAAVVAGIVALGGAWHHDRWNDLARDDLSCGVSETPRPVWVRGVISELLGLRNYQGYGPGDPPRIMTRLVLEISQVTEGRQWRAASGRALMIVAGDCSRFGPGQPVEAAGQLARVAGPLNPGEFDYRAYLRTQGIQLRLLVDDPSGLYPDPGGAEWKWVRWLGEVRTTCREHLMENLDARTAPLAGALILGQREEIDPEDNDAFARTGTTHLLAISGLQLQALAAALALCFRVVGFPRRLAYSAVALATIGYALLVGLAPSVVRSAVMTLTFCLAVIVNRSPRPANTLALAGVLTLILNPFFLFDVGCQLSFLAIGALIWLVPPAHVQFNKLVERTRSALVGPRSPLDELEADLQPWWRHAVQCLGSWTLSGVLTSLVVWLAALPLVALRFHLVSPIGVILNIPLIPLTSLALLLGALGMSFSMAWNPLGVLPIMAADGLLRITEAIVRWGVAQSWGHRFVVGPSWSIVLTFHALLGLATVLTMHAKRMSSPSRARLWQAVLWCVAVAWIVSGWLLAGHRRGVPPLDGDVLAVGHGLAVILQLEGGPTLLYDCGRMADPHVGRRIIAPALWSRNVTKIDSVFLSHADQDHFDALPDLLDRFTIGEVVIPPGFLNEENPAAALLLEQVRARGVPVRTIAAPATWDEGGAHFSVLHPPADWHPETSDNARSLVLDIGYAGRHVLLTGDLDQLGTFELTSAPRPEIPVDLMLAPHHGGKSANPSMLYNWAKPRTVMVSQRMPATGTNDALTPLERSGIPLLRTWQRGAVHIEWRADRVITEGFLDHHDRPRS